MPDPLKTIALLLPSSTAITGIVEVSQLGASLPDVSQAFLGLWTLAGVYALIAIVLEKARQHQAALSGSQTRA